MQDGKLRGALLREDSRAFRADRVHVIHVFVGHGETGGVAAPAFTVLDVVTGHEQVRQYQITQS